MPFATWQMRMRSQRLRMNEPADQVAQQFAFYHDGNLVAKGMHHPSTQLMLTMVAHLVRLLGE